MTIEELLKKLPKYVGNHRLEGGGFIISDEDDDIGGLYLHTDGKDWVAYYGGDKGHYLCMNPKAEEPPYDNAFSYGSTPQEALEGLYKWCIEHDFVKG